MVQTRDTAHGFYLVDLQLQVLAQLMVKIIIAILFNKLPIQVMATKQLQKVQLLIQIVAFFQSNYFREIISPGPSIYRTKLFLVLPKLQLLILIPVKQVKQQKLITLVTKDTVISTLF